MTQFIEATAGNNKMDMGWSTKFCAQVWRTPMQPTFAPKCFGFFATSLMVSAADLNKISQQIFLFLNREALGYDFQSTSFLPQIHILDNDDCDSCCRLSFYTHRYHIQASQILRDWVEDDKLSNMLLKFRELVAIETPFRIYHLYHGGHWPSTIASRHGCNKVDKQI